LEWQKWHRSESARFASGDPLDPILAIHAIRWLRDRPAVAADYERVAGGGPWGAQDLDKYDLARAKQLVEYEREHFRSVVRFLTAFAALGGVDASLLLGKQDEALLLRIDAAIQIALRKAPPTATALPAEPRRDQGGATPAANDADAAPVIEWTRPDSPARWSKVFGFSCTTLLRRFRDGTIRHKKLSTRNYQIAIDDLPAGHQSKFRTAQNPPAK
jgi:hypothetical protein